MERGYPQMGVKTRLGGGAGRGYSRAMMDWLLSSILKAVAWLPEGVALAMGRHWGWLLAQVVRLRRAYVLDTLARCFPGMALGERQAIYAGVCREQAVNQVELLRFAGGREAELRAKLDVAGEEHVKAALARGKGALILLAHAGNFDLMGLIAAKLFGYPLTVITKLKNRDTAVNRLWERMRDRAGMKTVPSHNAYRACVKALKKNELVGFMLDQNRPAEQAVFVEFFGKPAATTPGLAFMSAQSGAPVVPVFMHRTPEGRHQLEVQAALEPPPDREEATILAHTARYTKIIEDEVRRHPEQWLWWHKRWKSRPAEGGAAAAGL